MGGGGAVKSGGGGCQPGWLCASASSSDLQGSESGQGRRRGA